MEQKNTISKNIRRLQGLILVACMLFPRAVLHAQVEVSHQSDWFYIEPGTDLHIKGSLISLPGNADPISNLGDMYISDSVTCDGDNLIFGTTPDTITAEVILNGDGLQTLTGSTNMRFGKLTIRNTYDSLRLHNTVEVFSRLHMDFGNVDVNADTLDLLHTGYIVGEGAPNRIFTGAYGRVHSNRALILGNSYPDIAGIGLGFTVDGNLGSGVSIYRGNFPQTNVSNGSIERFYFFYPQFNADVSAPLSRYHDDTELQGNDEARLQFYRSSTSGVNWTLAGGTADTLTDVVSSSPSLAYTMTGTTALILAEGNCDSLPPIEFPTDTIPICGTGGNAWLAPNGITGMTSLWSEGTQNQDSIQVVTPGTYRVTITDLKGCPNEDSVEVVIAPVPQADFQVTPVCIGDSSQFQNQSTLANGLLTYHWDLNDVYTSGPDTSILSDPTILYTNPGAYAVTLTATSGLGCSHSRTANATVLPYPVADFNVADHCADSLLNFSNNSSVTPTAPMQFHWDFGNGDTSVVATPGYGFPSIGPQTITLATTSNGCTSTTTRTVTIHPNPVADFTHTVECLGGTTNFTNTTSIASGGLSYVWTFNGSQTSVLTDPSFNFSSAGSHPVTLVSTSGQGCSDDTTIHVTVNALPQPSFTANSACEGDPVTFSNNGPATSAYQWDFSGEGQSNQYNPQFVFNSSGAKTIQLIETDLNGCTDSITTIVNSAPAPIAGFSVNGNCEGSPISFLNTSSTPSGSMTYLWDFGDQNTSTQSAPIHTYSSDGTYLVHLVADNNGCSDTVALSVVIDSIPSLNLGGGITTCDSQYVFDAGNAGSTYLWSNGSMAQTLTATFNGDYWVSVINPAGCSNADTVSLVLNSVVTPQLGADSTFCDVAPLDAGYPGATYQWSTGATTQAIQPTSTGPYSVTVTDQNGCIGADTILATVVQAIQPDLGADLSLCDGQMQQLDPVNSGVSYNWNTGDSTVTINITQTGLYWVDLTDVNGCISRDSIDVIYHPNPVVDLGPDSTYCDSLAFDLTQSDVDVFWSTGATTPTETITATGIYSVELTNSITGCQSQDTIDLVISATPQVELGADTILCSGENLLLDAGNPGNVFTWNVGGSAQTQLASSSGIYQVDVLTPAGCVGTDSIDVVVNPPIDTYLGTDFTLCQGDQITVSSPILGGSYAWFQDGLPLSNTDRSLIISAFGTYVVVATDSSGCVASDTIEALQTGSGITAEYLVSTVNLFAGDTLQFVNLSFPEPFTSYWSFGDGAFSINEDPQHVYLVPGDYTATLEVSNGVCTNTLAKTLTIVPKTELGPPEPTEVVINDFVQTLLYPNPNDGTFTVEIELLEEGQLHITCVDMRGKVLFKESREGKDFRLEYRDLELAQGIYLLNLRVSERSETLKFMKR